MFYAPVRPCQSRISHITLNRAMPRQRQGTTSNRASVRLPLPRDYPLSISPSAALMAFAFGCGFRLCGVALAAFLGSRL